MTEEEAATDTNSTPFENLGRTINKFATMHRLLHDDFDTPPAALPDFERTFALAVDVVYSYARANADVPDSVDETDGEHEEEALEIRRQAEWMCRSIMENIEARTDENHGEVVDPGTDHLSRGLV